MSGKYDAIINLPHYVSTKRPQMSMHDRAAQFSPFAALTGYDEMVHETARFTDAWMELSEEELQTLNLKYHALEEILDEQPEVKFLYFVPDEKKTGGSYETVTGIVRKVDKYDRIITLQSGETLLMDHVVDIESENLLYTHILSKYGLER